MNRTLANFDDPKWTYRDLKLYAWKYRRLLFKHKNVPENINNMLRLYQTQSHAVLIDSLKKVQTYLYK